MLGTSNAFHLGHTTRACTHGIWMGTTVLECEDHVIVLLDTEGIDAVSSSQSSDAGILVMSILLSSYMVYNSFHVARNTDLEKMHVFAKLSSSIVVRQGSDVNTFIEFRRYFPKFMWLFRDATLIPVDEDGHRISAHDYLIQEVLSCGEKSDHNKDVKQAIVAYFPTTECVMLPPPSADPEVMQDIENNKENLTKKFNEGVDNLVSKLLQEIPSKCGYHSPNPMTGETLADLAKVYLEAINQPDAIPCLDNNWETVVALGISRAVDRLRNEYDLEMEAATAGKLPMELEEISQENCGDATVLMNIHRNIFEAKIKALRSQTEHLVIESHGGSGLREQQIESFKCQIVQFEDTKKEITGKEVIVPTVTGGLLFKYVQCNYSMSFDVCSKVFDEIYQPVMAKARSFPPGYTVDILKKDLDESYQQYTDKAIGPAKWEVLNSKQELISNTLLSLETIEEKDKELLEERSRAEEAMTKQMQAESAVMELNATLQEEHKMHEKEVIDMKEEFERTLEKVKSDLNEQIEQEKVKQEELHKAHMKEIADMTAENEQRLQDILEEQRIEMTKDFDEKMKKMKKKGGFWSKALNFLEDVAIAVPIPVVSGIGAASKAIRLATGARQDPGITCINYTHKL